MSKLSTIVTAGLATGTYLLAGQAFVTPVQPPASGDSLSSLPAGVTPVASIGDSEMAGSSTMAVLGVAGAMAVAASAHRRVAGSRMSRRAEPVTVAAGVAAAKAAGAAKAAAAAKGAAKAGGAVMGSAGTTTLVDAASENPGEFDPEVGGRKYMKWEQGTPQYEKAMAQKKARNTADWNKYTGRGDNFGADGNFGASDPDAKVDDYDPLQTLGNRWIKDAREMKGTYVGEFDPALMIGVTEPLGYFDPLGFCKKGDADTFFQLRTAEIKHGRVAMMGALGAVVQHYVKFPGFEKVSSGLNAVNEAPGSYGTIALFLVAGILETAVWTESKDKEPGNFGDPMGLAKIGDGYTVDMRNRELNNGRAAMFAVMGIIAAEVLTGKDGIEQLGLP